MADEQRGILARLLTETWPAKAASGILDALMLPGQVAGGILNGTLAIGDRLVLVASIKRGDPEKSGSPQITRNQR